MRVAMILMLGCAEPAVRTIVVAPPPSPPIEVGVELQAHELGPEPATIKPGPLVLDQPAHIKMRLGHYAAPERGIGLVIDRTDGEDLGQTVAKVRFDSESRIWQASPTPGPRGRLDYMRDHGYVLLRIWDTGRVVLYVPDPETGRGMGELELVRDGDAYPLR